MASVVTNVTIGDYRYTLWDDGHASAMVTDKTKSSYDALQANVTYEGATYALTGLNSCFQVCTSLTATPSIPSGVTTMDQCFYGCTSLTTAPTIPSSVTSMRNCFYNCRLLTTVPNIPSGVTNMGGCFMYCRSLTGTIAVHGTPSYYNSCFYNTTLPIRLICSSDTILPTWQQVAATGNNGNVIAMYVENNPAPTATLNVTRVGSDGSTVPNESGEWAYVQVETTVSTDQAPDNVARAPIITKDGSSVVPSTHASGTASYVDWVSLGDDKTHRIGATPRDLYKNGGEVIVTLAGTYSPMEFYTKPILNEHDEVIGYEGGVGASFGKHATREGVLDVAWDVESEGEVSCGVAGGLPAHTLSSKVTVDDVYPIGSIYMNVSSTNPSTLFPGTTWRALAPGRVLIGAGTTTDSRGESKTFSNGASGGEFSHLLSGQESGVKGHTHKLNECRSNAEASGYGLTATSGFSDRVLVDTSVDARKRATETSGDIAATNAHNNIQPYLVVHMWERTA